MKAIFSALVVATLFAACTGHDAQSSKTIAATTDSTNFTSITWIDSTTQELGKVVEGAQVEVQWRFRNTGSKPLVIEKVQPGCGCTIAEKPEAAIAPGAEGRISATFNSEGRVGTQHKNLVVQANTKQNTIHDLYFNVEVTPAK